MSVAAAAKRELREQAISFVLTPTEWAASTVATLATVAVVVVSGSAFGLLTYLPVVLFLYRSQRRMNALRRVGLELFVNPGTRIAAHEREARMAALRADFGNWSAGHRYADYFERWLRDLDPPRAARESEVPRA